MRIIAGSAKGIILQAPPSVTRPTMDRVRAAIFSILGERVPEARVLDLFAGTGAMGIEALSRGAVDAIFVDNNKKATELIRKNLSTAKCRGDVRQSDSFSYLKLLAKEETSFDLIFADPPYAKDGQNLAATLLESPDLLSIMSNDTLLILECEKKHPLPEHPKLERLVDRTYGISRVIVMRSKTPSTSH